jgi:hypothetical protein
MKQHLINIFERFHPQEFVVVDRQNPPSRTFIVDIPVIQGVLVWPTLDKLIGHSIAVRVTYALDVHRAFVIEDVCVLETNDIQVPVEPVLEILEIVCLGEQDDFCEILLLYHTSSLLVASKIAMYYISGYENSKLYWHRCKRK